MSCVDYSAAQLKRGLSQLTIIAVISVKLFDSFGCYGDVYLPLDIETVVGGLTAGVESGPLVSLGP
jgi:hypothetical protein